MDLLAAAKQGFETVDADPAFREKAVQFLEQWLSGGDFAPYRPQIEWLVSASKWSDFRLAPAAGAARSASARTA